MWAIWCKDVKDGRGDWLREMPSKVDDGGVAVLVFRYKTQACERAAQHYGFDTYSEAKRLDWCEVRQFPPTE